MKKAILLLTLASLLFGFLVSCKQDTGPGVSEPLDESKQSQDAAEWQKQRDLQMQQNLFEWFLVSSCDSYQCGNWLCFYVNFDLQKLCEGDDRIAQIAFIDPSAEAAVKPERLLKSRNFLNIPGWNGIGVIDENAPTDSETDKQRIYYNIYYRNSQTGESGMDRTEGFGVCALEPETEKYDTVRISVAVFIGKTDELIIQLKDKDGDVIDWKYCNFAEHVDYMLRSNGGDGIFIKPLPEPWEYVPYDHDKYENIW